MTSHPLRKVFYCMANINWKVRFKNPHFWLGLAGVAFAPVMSYFGAKPEDLTTWSGLGEIIMHTVQNPYLLGSIIFTVIGFFGVTVDHTTKGISDSQNALTYEKPKDRV